jgi:hypothetical protein
MILNRKQFIEEYIFHEGKLFFYEMDMKFTLLQGVRLKSNDDKPTVIITLVAGKKLF